MTAESLELAASELAADELRPEELPSLATDALVRGLQSPALARLAGQDPADVRESRDLFYLTLDELGIPIPDVDTALWNLVRVTAQAIASGELAAEAAARKIWRWQGRVVDSGDLRIFVGLASELEDHPDERPRLEREIAIEAETLLQRPQPRIWIKLMVRHEQSPLSRSVRSDSVAIETTHLPISHELQSRIDEWARNHHAILGGWPGAGGFPSVGHAERFVERGKDLRSSLQVELGPQYYVEYMPEPVGPPGVKLRRA